MSRRGSVGVVGRDLRAVVVIGLLTAGLAGAAALPGAGELPRAVGLIEVGEAAPVMFAVAPGTREVRLLAVGSAVGAVSVDEPVPVAAEVVWLDGDGAVAGSHPARWVAAPSEARAGWLDPRSLTLTPPAGARALVLRAGAGTGQLQLRAWGASPEPRDPEVAALRLDAHDAALLPHRLGLREGELTADELRALLRVRWEPLRPLDRAEMPVVGALAPLDEDRRAAAVRRSDGLWLAPGRAVAWTAPGSMVGWLESDADVEVVAVVEGLGAVVPGVEAAGRRLAVAMPGPGSLWVRAVAGPARVRWTVDDAADAADQEVVPEADGVVVLPPRAETVVQVAEQGSAWTLHLPEGAPAHTLRLGLRALGEATRAEVRVEHDARVAVYEVEVPAGGGAFEEARRDGARGAWTAAGDAQRWWLSVGAGARRVVVRSASPVAVDAAAQGLPAGTEPAMDAQRRTVWRHRAGLWSEWRTMDGRGAEWRLRSNTRREPVGEDAWAAASRWVRTGEGWREVPAPPRVASALEGEARSWRTVRPLASQGAEPGEAWMVDGPGGGPRWCPVRAGVPSGLRWRGEGGGLVAVRVLSPEAPRAPAAGAAWRLLADGHPVAGGALATAVGSWTGRLAPFEEVELLAAPGVTAWVRAGDPTCAGGRSERRGVPAEHGVVRWQVAVPPEGVSLSLGGVVDGPADAVVRVRGAAPVEGLTRGRTEREQRVALTPTARAAGLVSQPWRSGRVVDPVRVRVEADVGGTAVIEVQASGPAWLWLAEPGEAEATAPTVVRVRG